MARTALKLSNHLSSVKPRWLIDHHEAIHKAHQEDDLLFDAVGSWIVYVSFVLPCREALYTFVEAPDRQKVACDGSLECLLNIVDEYQDLAADPVLLNFFQIQSSVLPGIVSSSQVYGEVNTGYSRVL